MPKFSRKEQEKQFIDIVLQNPYVKEIINNPPFPDDMDWYLAAGCLTQSVWNYLSGKPITEGIEDYDLIYYDAANLDKESENRHQRRINRLFKNLSPKIEVVNEARVHLWFESHFGKKIDQYLSCEDALSSWNACSAVGIRVKNKKINVCAPLGFDDLFSMILRSNKNHQAHVVESSYNKKAKKWSTKWPQLTVIPWD